MATKVKFKAQENDFVLDHYTKPVQKISKEQIMNALNMSASFNVVDYFGCVDLIKFTITNIEIGEYGDYTYTVESNRSTSKDYFLNIRMICEGYENIAYPRGYSRL